MFLQLQGGGISMVGRLVCAIAQGFLGPQPQDLEIRMSSKDLQHRKESTTRQDFFGILNMLLSFTAGVYMFKVAASVKTREQEGIVLN